MNTQLKPTLGTLHLWGIAVGLVISGEYFGWSYGWGVAGTLGFLVTTLMVAAMYSCFIFSFTELTTAIPHAGGPFAYSRRAFGEKGGLIAGIATLIEFVFAPPAIALAMSVFSLSALGLPPFSGFWAKFYVFKAAINVGDPMIQIAAVLGLVGSVVAAFYYLRLIKVMWFDPAPSGTDAIPGEAKAVAIGAALFSFPVVLGALVFLDPLAKAAAAAFGLAS